MLLQQPEDGALSQPVVGGQLGGWNTAVLVRTYGSPDLTVQVAEAGPLVAMKLQSIMNRGSAKEGTDLLDIIRLILDDLHLVGELLQGALSTS